MNTFIPRVMGSLRAACHPSNVCEITWGNLQGIIEDEFTRWLEEQKPGKIPEALRSALFDELCRFEGIDPKKVGASAGRIAKALQAIRKSDNDVTPEEIRKRGRLYLKTWNGLAPTARGLSQHWPALGTNGHEAAIPSLSEPENWLQRIRDKFPGSAYELEIRQWRHLPEIDKKQITQALSK